MRIAVCLRRELQKVIFRWKIIGKKVVEFGRRNACLNDIFCCFIHRQYYRLLFYNKIRQLSAINSNLSYEQRDRAIVQSILRRLE